MQSISNKLISLFIGSVLMVAVMMPSVALAEYYVVYYAPAVVCDYCHQYHQYHHKKQPWRHKHKRSSYRISYYPAPVCPYVDNCYVDCAPMACSPCHAVTYRSRCGYEYYEYNEYTYDPDMSTGDDDASIDPNMNWGY